MLLRGVSFSSPRSPGNSLVISSANMSEEQTGTTINLSAEAVRRILQLRDERAAYEKTAVDEMHRWASNWTKLSEMRIAFHEKLILLAGGSFALSLTLLGSLQHETRVNSITGIRLLEIAWSLLLLSIVLSWVHNRRRFLIAENLSAAATLKAMTLLHSTESLFFKRVASVFKGTETAELNLSNFFSLVSDVTAECEKQSRKSTEEFVKNSIQETRVATRLSNYALFLIFLAFLVMLLFAIKNASALSGI
jgi:hypothetical protein